MADYDPVTTDDFIARFPIFADAEQTQLDALLLEAQGIVTTTWRAADYKPAILYYMAHMLALDGSQEDGEVAVGPSGAGQIIASESISGMSVSYFNSAASRSSKSESDYATTEYGRRFARLLDLNFYGPLVI